MKSIDKYYEYLKGAGADVPDSTDSFKSTLSDASSAEKYYSYLKDNKFDTAPTFDSFSKTLGLFKKKDQPSQENISTSSQSNLEGQGPEPVPSISSLIKERRRLAKEKNAPKLSSAPGVMGAPAVSVPTIDYDAEIAKVDEQIKSRGLDPLEIETDLSDFDLTDDQILSFYDKKKVKPLTAKRDIAAQSWHSTVRNNISKIEDETARTEKMSQADKLIADGARLPSSDFNTALQFGKNAYAQILDFTAGDGEARDKAINNFKKDYLPVLGNILIRDKGSVGGMKDLPVDIALAVDDIFNPSMSKQTRDILSQDYSDNAPAQSAKERRLSELETQGLSILSDAVNQEIENNGQPIIDLKDWTSKNSPRLTELTKKIESLPDVDKSLLANYTKEKLELESMANAQSGIKAQADVVKKAEEDYKKSGDSRAYDIYAGEVDKYNIMVSEMPDLKGKADRVNALASEINKSSLPKEDADEYQRLISEYKSIEEKAKPVQAGVSPWFDYIKNRYNTQFKRYPATLADRLMELQQEVDGEFANPAQKFVLGLGSIVEKGKQGVEILYDALFTSPEQKLENDYERLGQSQSDRLLTSYEKEKDRLIESPIVTIISDDVKKQIEEINSRGNLNEQEKEAAKKEVLKNGLLSGGIYSTSNPNAGDFNFTAKSVLNTFATVAPQILGSIGMTAATGGGTGTLFLTTAMQAFSPYYNEATEKGVANPVQYATAHTLVDAATELLGTTNLDVLKKAFQGKKGFGAKFFRDLSQEEFDKLVAGSKNAFKNYAKQSGRALRSTGEESFEEFLASYGGDIVNQTMYGEQVDVGKEAGKEFITTAIGSLPLNLVGIPISVNRNNIGSKFGLYNAAADLRNSITVLGEELRDGKITQKEYQDRVKLVTEYASIVRDMPKTYADGNPMRDDDKAKYAFNTFIATRKKDDTIPPQQQEKVNEVVTKALNENDKILSNATNQSKVQEGRTEGNIGQPQGINQGQPEVGQGEGQQGQAQITQANVGDSDQRSQGPVAGARLFNEPNPQATELELEFKKSKNIDTPEPAPIRKLDENKSMAIADAYDAAVDSPNDPEVQQAYQAMADETMDQFKFIKDAGITVELWTGQGEPYANSEEMIKDVRDNKHMYVFSTEEGFGDNVITDEQRAQNALLRDSGEVDVNGKKLLINDVFRFVHDFFGHTRLGNSFGAIGEENAWNVHARMYSPLARRAMTTETRGQNSWVNFNKNLRNADGTIKKKGDEGYVAPRDRPFADQKMALLPEEFSQIEDSYSVSQEAPQVTTQNAVQQAAIDQTLADSVAKVEQSFASAGLKIRIVDSSKEGGGSARGSQGVFISETGEIIIDRSKLADEIEAGIVVWHEAAHPVMNIIRNKNKPLYDKVVRGLQQAAQKNPELAAALNWAQREYTKEKESKRLNREVSDQEASDRQNDEAIVETIGRIGAGVIDINKLDAGLKQSIIDFINLIARALGLGQVRNTDIQEFKNLASQIADVLTSGRDIAEVVGAENVGNFKNDIVQERIGAEDVLSKDQSGKMKVTEVADTFEKAVDDILDPSSDPNSRISRFLKNAYEDLKYFFGQYSGDTGLDWYTNKVKEFDLKLKDASDVAIKNGEMPAENSLRNEDNMDLFKAVLALSSIGVNPRENVKAAFAIWKTFNQDTKTFNKYQPGQVSIRTNIEDGKGGYDAPSGTIVKETDKYLDIQQKNGKVRRLKKSDLAREFEVVYKNSDGKEITKNLRLVKVNPSNTIFRSGPTKIKIANSDILSQTETSDGIQGKGWTTKGNIVAINLNRIEKLLDSKQTLREAIDWLNSKHPIAELREYNPGVPDVEGGKGKIDPKGERLGSYIIGEKLGAFHQNVAGTPTELTMDLWWSRTWNRYMGTLMTKDENGDPTIQETPRTDTERNIMREAAATAAESLGLEVHELQAALWYLEQQMYKRMGAAVESYSFVDGINELLLGYGKTNEEIQPQRYGVDNTETDQRRSDAAARAANILYGESGQESGRKATQASVGNRNLIENAGLDKQMTSDGKGNYVFFHYSGKKLNKIDPSKFGANLATGRDERPGVGLSMYYVDNKTLESGVPSDFGYAVRIPKNKVYPFNEDPLNLYDQAKTEFEKDYPGQAFDANKQIGYITKVANDNGFDITVANWNIKGRKALRAQTTKSLKPEIYKQKVFKNGSEREQFNEELAKLKPGVQASVGNRLAPNGKPSNLNEVQYAQVRTPEFKNWFGDWENDPANASKAIDGNGEPRVFYHGTNSEQEFDTFEGSDYFFVSPDVSFAEEYANAKNGRVLPVYINTKNLFDPQKISKEERDEIFSLIEDDSLNKGRTEDQAYEDAYQFVRRLTSQTDDNWIVVESDVLKDYINSNEYDSIKVRETGIDNIAVSDPNQIKSAIGNTGAFSTTDNRIQASVGNRSEEDLRASGKGKERNRALASKYGDLNPKVQAKIEDDAVTYFQRTNKQTAEAVNQFLDGLNIIDAADYVLGNPDIPEVSKVWMAAEVAKRLNAEIDAAQDDVLKDALIDKQASIYNEFAKKATSLGQAVQAFIAFKNDPNATEFFLPKILRQLEKAGVKEVTEEQKADIVNLLREVNKAANGLPKDKAIIKLSHYLAGLAPMKPMDVLQSLWYAKILSGVTTQSLNFFANIFNTVFELPAVGLRVALMNKSPMALAAGARGFASGVAKGAVTAADIIKSGVRSKEVDKYFSENPLEYFTWSKWLGKKGQIADYIPPLNFGAWKYVGRLLAATDALFATANQEAIANMLAYAEAAGSPAGNNFKKANEILGNSKMSVLRAKAQAKAEGFDIGSVQYKRRVIEIVAMKRKGFEEADAIGKRITMNFDPEGWTKPFFNAVVALQKDIPIIKMVVPFARIVANLTENSLNYTPFGLVRSVTGVKNPTNALGVLLSGKKPNIDKLTTEERVDLFSKFAIGIGSLAVLAANVGDDDDDWFEITAGGHPDLQKKYELQKGGWRPYTITLKDGTKVSYKDWPIAGILAGLGHIRDAEKYAYDDNTQSVLYATGFFLNLYDKSLLKGLQDFFGAAVPGWNRGSYAPDDRAGDRLTKYAAQQVRSVVLSNLSQQSGKLYSEIVTGDPQRDAKTFMEVLYRDLPMFNDGIRPIIDVFGDEVKYTTTERLAPVMSSPESDKIIKWLNENKLFVGVPKKKNIILLDGTERPMNDQEYYDYRKLAGQKSKKLVMEFMDLIEDKEIGEKAFEASIDAAREEAYGEMLLKINNL